MTSRSASRLTPEHVAILATLDTKAAEASYLAQRLVSAGLRVVVLDASLSSPGTMSTLDGVPVLSWGAPADAQSSGTSRTERMALAAASLSSTLTARHAAGALDAVMGIGGGTGAWLFTEAVRSLPFGLCKLLIATNVGRDAAQDIMVLTSVTDIAGVNRFYRSVADRAAAAVSGMLSRPSTARSDVPLVGMTMYGITTEGATHAREHFERSGFECATFHANGVGGPAMEAFAEDDAFVGVLDWTTTELANQMFGTGRSVDSRLRGAGVPRVVAPGGADVLTMRAPLTERFAARRIHWHLPDVALIRLTADEAFAVGAETAGRVNAYPGPITVLAPMGGFSSVSGAGAPLADPDADRAWLDGVRSVLDPRVAVLELDTSLNHELTARAGVAETLRLMALAHPNTEGVDA